MSNVIKWEYWQNPLGGGPEYVDEMDADIEEDDDINIFDDDNDKPTAIRPMIPTAGGLMPVHAYGNLSANCNFWMMHTNFNLSKKALNIIKKIPGVETLCPVFRYRARVGFGKCFDSAQVKAAIHRAFNVPVAGEKAPDLIIDEAKRAEIETMKDFARRNYPFWMIYLIPNGAVTFRKAEDMENFKASLALLKEAQELAGGVIYASHEL
jgi:hypothetical protein